jgi:uncharacterized protein with WD repeat
VEFLFGGVRQLILNNILPYLSMIQNLDHGVCFCDIISGHANTVMSVSYSPDGQYVASGSYDNSIKIWSAAQGTCLHTWSGHSECVTSVSYSPDGQYLASSSEDDSVKVWSMACVETRADKPDELKGKRALSPDEKFEHEGVVNSMNMAKKTPVENAIVWSVGHSLVIQRCDFTDATGLLPEQEIFIHRKQRSPEDDEESDYEDEDDDFDFDVYNGDYLDDESDPEYENDHYDDEEDPYDVD